MLSLFHLSQRRTPVFIALMAMLLLFIAPVISTSLEHRRADIAHVQTNAMPAMDMSGQAMNSNAIPAPTQSDNTASSLSPSHHHLNESPSYPQMGHHTRGMMDDIACGYCQLLIHLPLIFWAFIPFIWLTLHIVRTSPTPLVSRLIPPTLPGDALPRAPPLH